MHTSGLHPNESKDGTVVVVVVVVVRVVLVVQELQSTGQRFLISMVIGFVASPEQYSKASRVHIIALSATSLHVSAGGSVVSSGAVVVFDSVPPNLSCVVAAGASVGSVGSTASVADVVAAGGSVGSTGSVASVAGVVAAGGSEGSSASVAYVVGVVA